jgi:hypothetical protein
MKLTAMANPALANGEPRQLVSDLVRDESAA